MHLAVTQDEVGQDGEHRTTCGALETPDGDPTQTDTTVMVRLSRVWHAVLCIEHPQVIGTLPTGPLRVKSLARSAERCD